MDGVPVVDLRADDAPARLDAACREVGFFCLVGHGVDPERSERLVVAAREFFALGENEKASIAMAKAGRAWRGWFPLGGELTSGVADQKEGLYFGAELGPDDHRVRAGVPLHGANLFPSEPATLRPAVLAWIDAMTELGHRVMAAVAVGLGLGQAWFAQHLTVDPVVLFRIFRYPPGDDAGWGVAEHTDYGLLTLLLQDETSGLEVKTPAGWVDVAPVPGAFVCNVGDMLERITGGRYRSTPHRVRNRSGRDRLSFPFFFDPSWDARVEPLPLGGGRAVDGRWDGADVFTFDGTYGDYLTAKVARVFPELAKGTSCVST